MEEKKLTDEEIVKALENQANGYGAGIVGDLSALTLDLIHRQKATIEQQNKEYIELDLELRELRTELDKELTEHEEFTKQAKAEIERLTEESNEMFDRHAKELQAATILLEKRNKEIERLTTENKKLTEKNRVMEHNLDFHRNKKFELQKQVDELKKTISIKVGYIDRVESEVVEWQFATKKAVKDTAKEILSKWLARLKRLKEQFDSTTYGTNREHLIATIEIEIEGIKNLAKRYGVEVE